MSVTLRRAVTVAALSTAAFLPRRADAQISRIDVCSQGPLSLTNCAGIQLSTQLGVGPGGLNLFQIAIQNLGSQSTPSLPTSIYLLALTTGQLDADPGTIVDTVVSPTSVGGALIANAQGWALFENGSAIFLSAPGNDGIGGCAASGAVNGFGQMASTCGTNQFITFDFYTPRLFIPGDMQLADLETIALDAGNNGDSCPGLTSCTITQTQLSSTPEPASALLTLTGLAALAALRQRRKPAARTGYNITTSEG